MLKKLLYFFLFYVMFVFSANSQQITYTPQTANGYQFKYLKVDSLFHLSVGDTSLKKGVARAGAIVFRNADSLYYGYNGVRWVLLGGTGKVYADYGLINVNDSTLKADSLQLTTLAKSYKIVDSLDKLYLKLTGGIVTGTVDIQQPLSLGEGGISRGRLNFFNEDNGNTGSLYSIPYTSNREWLLPDYDGTLTTEDSLRSKTDSLLNIINGRATFGDVRDIVHDTANVLVRIADSAAMLNPYLRKVDTAEFVKKTRTLTIGKNGSATDLSDDRVFLDSVPNINTTNATNITSGTLDDARLSSNVALLNAAQTFTANKTNTALFISNANGLGGTQDETKGIVLSNTTAATSGVTVQMPPALYFLGSNYCTSGAGPGFNGLGSNYADWKIQVEPVSGSEATMDSKMTFSSRYGNSLTWNKKMEINKDGLIANIGGINTLTIGTGDGVNNGTLLIKARNGQIATITNNNSNFTFSGSNLFGVSANIVSFNGAYGNGTKIYSSGVFVSPKSGADAPGSVNSSLVVRDNAYIGSNSAAPTSGLGVVGRTRLTGLETEIITRTADYTVTETDHTILVDATSGNVTITLRTAVGSKQLYNIKRIDNSGNTVTVATTSSQTIDGATTYTGLSAQYKYVQVQANGAAYFIISNN